MITINYLNTTKTIEILNQITNGSLQKKIFFTHKALDNK